MNRYHKQYLGLVRRLGEILENPDITPSEVSAITDNLVTVSFWDSQAKINWKQLPTKDFGLNGWTILDETVMLLDGLTDRFIDSKLMRKLGFFILNLPKDKMQLGTVRRWRDMCDRVKKRSTFYSHEVIFTYGSKAEMLQEHHKYFMERFAKDQLDLV